MKKNTTEKKTAQEKITETKTINLPFRKIRGFLAHTKKAAILTVALIFLCFFVNASIMATASTDKTTLGENEVALLSLKITNSSQTEENKINIKIESEEGIVFYDEYGETTIFLKTIDAIKPGEIKEFFIKIKAKEITKPSLKIYAYYGKGANLTQAAMTTIQTITAAAKITAETKTGRINENQTTEINFTLTNASKKNIYRASAEALAPEGYEILSPPIIKEKLIPNESIQQKFSVKTPIDAKRGQEILIVYGYFDDTNAPHYFEKNFPVEAKTTNYQLLGIIGIIVLAIAGYLFIKKGKGDKSKPAPEKETWETRTTHKKQF